MKADPGINRFAAKALFVAVVALLAASHAVAQQPASTAKPTSPGKAPMAAAVTDSQTKAQAILMRMAEFLGSAQRFSVTVRGEYDAVQKSGQKIEFGENRKVTLARPDRLRVEGERSDGAKVLTVFDGKEITVIDSASNVYATAPQPGSVDETIVYFVRDLGMRLPLAVLLVSRLPAELKERVRVVEYVEKTNIDGMVSHHLAARTDTVDFQIWIADGDKPLPHRVVLTYKNAPGQPQFRAQLSDWNLAPVIADSAFLVKAPDGAQKIAFAAQLARVATAASKKSSDKGAK